MQEHAQTAEEPANILITAQAEFLDSALNELRGLERQLRSVTILAPDVALCSVPDVRAFTRAAQEAHPIFTRHLAPVQATIELKNTEADLENLAVGLAELPTFTMLERGQHFSV